MSLIEQILRVLTYFIRCSELAENTEVCPSLTTDIDDTTTLISTSDIVTPVTCSAADVTLSSSCSTSTVAQNPSTISAEKLQSNDDNDNTEFVLKPAPSSSGRGIHVRFQNGVGGTSLSLITAPSSTDQNHSSIVASNGSDFNHSTLTTFTDAQQSTPHVANNQLVYQPHILFRSDVSDSLLGITCSGCSPVQPCEECCENTIDYSKSKNLSKRNGDVIPLVNMRNVSDVPSVSGEYTSVRTDCKENLTSSKLCQLSPTEVNENVPVERIAHVGCQQVEELKPKLFHVPSEKPGISSPYLCRGSTNLPGKHSPVKLSQVVQYERSNSMFDEYFDGRCPVIDLCSSDNGGESALSCQQDDTSTLYEIMNEQEPCPDVRHIDVSHISSSSSSSEMTADLLPDSQMAPVFHPPSGDMVPPSSTLRQSVPDPSSLSVKFDNNFDEQHFVAENREQHLDDIPDGPSKQMISSAIKLMQDVCLDCTSQAGVDDLADIPASEYFSQPGLGLSRGRQRHPSGQSNTSVRCW